MALATRYSSNPKTGAMHDMKSSGALHPLSSAIVKARRLSIFNQCSADICQRRWLDGVQLEGLLGTRDLIAI